MEKENLKKGKGIFETQKNLTPPLFSLIARSPLTRLTPQNPKYSAHKESERDRDRESSIDMRSATNNLRASEKRKISGGTEQQHNYHCDASTTVRAMAVDWQLWTKVKKPSTVWGTKRKGEEGSDSS